MEQGSRTLWFATAAEYASCLESDRSDGFLIALLSWAMHHGYDLTFEAPLSQRLYFSVNHFLIPVLLTIRPHAKPIRIVARPRTGSLDNCRNGLPYAHSTITSSAQCRRCRAGRCKDSPAHSVGGPRAGDTGVGSSGARRAWRIFRNGSGSVMYAISRMSPPHAGHSSGNSPPTSLRRAAPARRAGGTFGPRGGNGWPGVSSGGRSYPQMTHARLCERSGSTVSAGARGHVWFLRVGQAAS
jgi:hypothetical protein